MELQTTHKAILIHSRPEVPLSLSYSLEAGVDGEDADESVGVAGVQGLSVGGPGKGHAVGLGGALAKDLLEVGAQVVHLGGGGEGGYR